MFKGSTQPANSPAEEAKKLLAEKVARLGQSTRVKNFKDQPGLFRLEVPAPDADPLSWLSAQPGTSKFYWSDREQNFAAAALGQADLVSFDGAIDCETLFRRLYRRLVTADGEARYYGGMRFSGNQPADPSWKVYSSCRFFLPRFELGVRKGKGFLACNLLLTTEKPFSPETVLSELDALVFSATEAGKRIPRLVKRDDRPDRARWGQNLDAALASLERGALKKIVLARKSSLTFDAKLNPFVLLQSLKKATKDCFHFGFVPVAETAFIGASPERLYARDGRDLKTEALAGTRPRGKNKPSDGKLAQELLQSEKDKREHGLVVEGIREALSPLSKTLQVEDRVQLLKLARSQHLLCAVQARLKDETTDAQILRCLHPTPAVGGYPTADALREIGRLESFDRGWYAGPIGWVGRDRVEFGVGIRSGLVDGSRLHLFAGAGIVAGSTAQGEWDEIENKMSDFIKILAGS